MGSLLLRSQKQRRAIKFGNNIPICCTQIKFVTSCSTDFRFKVNTLIKLMNNVLDNGNLTVEQSTVAFLLVLSSVFLYCLTFFLFLVKWLLLKKFCISDLPLKLKGMTFRHYHHLKHWPTFRLTSAETTANREMRALLFVIPSPEKRCFI